RARSRRSDIRSVFVAFHPITELRSAFYVENIVIDNSVACPSCPIGMQNKVRAFIFTNINRVVVDESILYRTGKLDPAVVIVLADVVANDGSDVARAVIGTLRTVVADQQETALIVVAVVVLNDRIAAVPVGVEAFGIVLSPRPIHF